MSLKKAIVICGPTCSGKTNFGHILAKNYDGEIINADSMQIYRQLPIMTASPSKTLTCELPYHLYNFLDIDNEYSAVKYTELASNSIKSIWERNKLSIIVGGSGLYINMLTNGYNNIEPINIETRDKIRKLRNKIGPEKFFEELVKKDPSIVLTLNINDTQRTLRAFEIFEQTGKSITDFHNDKVNDKIIPLDGFEFKIIFLLPERSFLHFLCNQRLEVMFKEGGVEEVRDVFKKYGNINTTAMKTLGVQELIRYFKNEITLEGAKELANIKTRQYAKRQVTWFKHQIKEKKIILEYSNMAEYEKAINTSINIL